MGVSKIWLSHELSLPEISQLTKNTEMPFGIVVSGRTELMTMKHCLLPAKNNCKRNCQACPHRKKRFISKTGWHTNFQ
jgi:collagenase-like PrtC family protease